MTKFTGKDRRQTMVAAARYAAALGLAATGAFAAVKRRILVRNGACDRRGLCAGCRELQDCSLPPAVNMKEALERSDNG